jgi:hypothetical protein
MTTLTNTSAPPSGHEAQPETDVVSETADEVAAAMAAARLAVDEAAARHAAREAAPARYQPSPGTGVRNGLVRTRTVRSNTGRALLRLKNDRGAATAEYIVATMAAVGFAGLLIVILRGDEVRGILTELVRGALTVG